MATAHYPIAQQQNTHSIVVGYLCWLFGFLGMHRFYYGKPMTGTIWFFTVGLLGIGWIIDLFLIPAMDAQADRRYVPGHIDYNVAWLLLVFFGLSASTASTWARSSPGSSGFSPAACSAWAGSTTCGRSTSRSATSTPAASLE